MIRRVLAVLALVVVLASCQLDAAVDVAVDADGTGTVALTVTVDADVVAQVPGLAGALNLDDATTQGWTAQGPTATDDGGLTVSLAHPFSSVAEASNLLNSLGPPFTGIALAQTARSPHRRAGHDHHHVVGLAHAARRHVRRVRRLRPAGRDRRHAVRHPARRGGGDAVGLDVDPPDGGPARRGGRHDRGIACDGGVRWDAPLDGSTTDLATTAVLGGSGGGGWADTVATVALVLLVLWLIAAVVLAVLVVRARRRRAARRRYR